MDEARAFGHAAWAGVAGLALLVAGVVCYGVATSDPTAADAALRADVLDGGNQNLAMVATVLLPAALVLLLWWTTALRRVLAARAVSQHLTQLLVPGMAIFAGLLLVGTALDLSSTIAAAWTDRFRPDVNTVRALGVAGATAWLGGLVGAALVVGVTSRVLQLTRSAPAWVVWGGYLVAFVCTFALQTYGIAMLVFGLWLVGAVAGVLRVVPSLVVTSAAPGVPEQPVVSTPTAPEVRQ